MKQTPNYNLLLGSGSPRRRELLAAMDIPFEVIKIKDVDETYPDNLETVKVPEFLSRLKASSYRNELVERELLLTADTVVILDGQILGKPANREDAIRMLKDLSGRTHLVVTGVTLTTTSQQHTFSEITEVEFADMSDKEIEYYVDHYRPFDKAGAYGIQEWIGQTSVKAIRGCFYNVMGLPTARLYKELATNFNLNLC